MRVPGRLAPETWSNVHDAFWAALLAVQSFNATAADVAITHLATPGLGTGVGGVPPAAAARLMALAYASWRRPMEAEPLSSFEREASLRRAAQI